VLEWLQSNVLRTPADIERKLTVPVIGTIPVE
jgi:hypothetical protein